MYNRTMEITRDDFDAWRYMITTLHNLNITIPEITLNIAVNSLPIYDIGQYAPIEYENYEYIYTINPGGLI